MFANFMLDMWRKAARETIAGTPCEACSKRSEVHILATRADGEVKEVLLCKDHMLDPGPLLDW